MNSAIMMLEKTAERFPNRCAVRDENDSFTFSKLREAGLSVAAALMRDAEGNSPVIVWLPKSAKMLACFMGAMYAGRPYVPVAEDIPEKRLRDIAANIGAGQLITSGGNAKALKKPIEGFSIVLCEDALEAEPKESAALAAVSKVIDCDPIYIMYTSGSTGVPKGVAIPHRGIIDYADWVCETFQFDDNTVLGNQSAFFFDNSTLDIFSMLKVGAQLIIIPEVLHRYPTKLPEFICENGINTIFWVPTVLIAVANSGVLEKTKMPCLKKVLFCGEAMPNRQLNIWRKNCPDILYANLYGPTEITDVCTYYIVDRPFKDSDPLPIGKACRNMRATILREDNTPAAVGETGELCISGSALTLGYWNSPEITDRVLITNPNVTAYREPLYRTGDLAYMAEDGNIIYVGRSDSQIKLKGLRIELGEAETAAKTVDSIKNACVLFDADRQDIVLFAETDEDIKLRRLNLELKKLIPAYMAPTRLVCLKELPKTPNGKIDRVLLKKTFIEQN